MSYQPADHLKRLIAYIIDSIILGIIVTIVILVVTVPLGLLGYSVGLFDLFETLGEDIITNPAALTALITIIVFYIINLYGNSICLLGYYTHRDGWSNHW